MIKIIEDKYGLLKTNPTIFRKDNMLNEPMDIQSIEEFEETLEMNRIPYILTFVKDEGYVIYTQLAANFGRL